MFLWETAFRVPISSPDAYHPAASWAPGLASSQFFSLKETALPGQCFPKNYILGDVATVLVLEGAGLLGQRMILSLYLRQYLIFVPKPQFINSDGFFSFLEEFLINRTQMQIYSFCMNLKTDNLSIKLIGGRPWSSLQNISMLAPFKKRNPFFSPQNKLSQRQNLEILQHGHQ